MAWAYVRTGAACQHCKQRRYSRPRGLCHVCWSDRAIRALYPARSRGGKWADEGGGDFCGGYQRPSAACEEPPGTEGKIEELAKRVAARVALWHPADCRREVR